MRSSLFARFTIALLLALSIPWIAASGSTSRAVQHTITPDGTALIEDPGAVTPTAPTGMRDPYIWRSQHASVIGSSVGISDCLDREDVMVGQQNATPSFTEIFEAAGAGTAYWTVPSYESQVAARRGVYALADYTATGIVLTGWFEDLGTPAWSHDFPGGQSASRNNTLMVNMDGTRVLFGFFYGGQVRFIALEAVTGTILVDTIITLASPSLRNMDATDDGRYVDLNCGAIHVVYDVDLNVERTQVNVGASTNPCGISETGEWIVSGFTTSKAYQWDEGAGTYLLRWTRTTPSHYAGVSAVSEQGFWIVGWYSSSYNQNRYQRWNLETGQPDWTYDSPTSTGQVQDLPVSLDYSRSRSSFAIGCWGDASTYSPEILVLSAAGEELFSMHAPGSMFDVAIAEDGRYVAATGKLVHANIMGSGSDAYCAHAGDPMAVESSEVLAPHLSAFPNPSRGAITFRAARGEATSAIRILDQSGRLVRTLPAGVEQVWRGTDDLGQAAPAGVYYCKAKETESLGIRIVLVR